MSTAERLAKIYPIEVLDIIPKNGGYDDVQVIHRPMAGFVAAIL